MWYIYPVQWVDNTVWTWISNVGQFRVAWEGEAGTDTEWDYDVETVEKREIVYVSWKNGKLPKWR